MGEEELGEEELEYGKDRGLAWHPKIRPLIKKKLIRDKFLTHQKT